MVVSIAGKEGQKYVWVFLCRGESSIPREFFLYGKIVSFVLKNICSFAMSCAGIPSTILSKLTLKYP